MYPLQRNTRLTQNTATCVPIMNLPKPRHVSSFSGRRLILENGESTPADSIYDWQHVPSRCLLELLRFSLLPLCLPPIIESGCLL